MCLSNELARQAREIHEQVLINGLGHRRTQGSCIYASILLSSMLEKFGDYKDVTIRGGDGCSNGGYKDISGAWHGHYWVEVDDGEISLVMDITADQFGGPEVVVLPVTEAKNYVAGDQHIIDAQLAKEKIACLLAGTQPKKNEAQKHAESCSHTP